MECPETDCTAAAWTSDGSAILKGSPAGELKVWRPIGGSIETLHKMPRQKITAIAVSHDASLVAIGCATGSVRVFNQDDGCTDLGKHDAPVNVLAFKGRSDVLASAGEDRLIKTWNWRSKKNIATLSGHPERVTGISWNPAGTRIASVDAAVELRIRDPTSATLEFRRNVSGMSKYDSGLQGTLNGVAWSNDGRHIATCGKGLAFQEGYGAVDVFRAELPEK